MKVIKIAEVEVVDQRFFNGDRYQFYKRRNKPEIRPFRRYVVPEIIVTEWEEVVVEGYINSRNEKEYIALSEEVREALALPQNSYNGQKREIYALQDQCIILRKQIKEKDSMICALIGQYDNMNWKQRLRFLFTGE